MKSAREQDRKIALGMLSTQMQRVERAVTGRNKGPPPITSDPELFQVVAPTPEASPRRRRAKQQAEQHPSAFSSGPDLLWRPAVDGNPGPSKAPPAQRQQFARFFPSANRGKLTSRATLAAMAERQSRDVACRAHAARAPAQLAVRLSPQVLAMCEEYQIDIRALMREGANPLAEHVPVMHGPYTPSWDVAIGVADPQEEGSRSLPVSARSAPASSARAQGASSARKPKPPAPKLLPEEREEVEKQMGPELEELRKHRQDALRRRAKITLDEQRRNEQSVELEKQQESWRERRHQIAQKQLDKVATARRARVVEAEEARQSKDDAIAKAARAEAKAVRKRWKEEGVEQQRARKERVAFREELARKQDAEHTAKVEADAQRVAARHAAVAEYEAERVSAEREALDRAQLLIEERRNAAETRNAAHEQRRQSAVETRSHEHRKKEEMLQDRYQQRLEHNAIIEQQRQERMQMPFRAHEAAHRRQEEAPLEMRRMLAQREMRLRAQLAQADDEVAENKREKRREHRERVEQQREQRAEVVQRIDAAARERQGRTEEHARKAAAFDAHVAKLQAKKELQLEMRRQEREAFNKAQSDMLDAVYKSSIGNETLTDTALDSVVTGGGSKKKK